MLERPLRQLIAWTDENPLAVPVAVAIRWPIVFYRQLRRDRAFVRAAGMAYISLIAIVPLLVLFFAVLGATGAIDSNPEAVYALFFEQFLGDIPGVRDTLLPGLMQVDLRALSLTGVISLLIVAARLYLMVERAYNDIFGVPISRGLGYRLLNFYFTLTAVPLIVALTTINMSNLAQHTSVPVQGWVAGALQFAMILTALKAFPCTRVAWGPALIGSTVTWMLMEAGRAGFAFYIVWFASDDPLRAIYGAMAIIPVFLLYLYLEWIFILLGVEIAYTVQHYDSLIGAELEQIEAERRTLRLLTVDDALEMAAWVGWSYSRGLGPITTDEVAERTGIAAREARPILRVLAELGILVESDLGWLLAQPPEQIELSRLAIRWRQATAMRHRAGDRARRELEAAIAQRMSGTLQDAIDRWMPAQPTEVLPEAEEAEA